MGKKKSISVCGLWNVLQIKQGLIKFGLWAYFAHISRPFNLTVYITENKVGNTKI